MFNQSKQKSCLEQSFPFANNFLAPSSFIKTSYFVQLLRASFYWLDMMLLNLYTI